MEKKQIKEQSTKKVKKWHHLLKWVQSKELRAGIALASMAIQLGIELEQSHQHQPPPTPYIVEKVYEECDRK